MTDLIRALIRMHYPASVWFPTENGWASREPTKEDVESRKRWVIKMYQNRYPELVND